MCVRFAPIFWDFNVWKCYIPKWLIIYCSPIIHKLREPTQNGVIQFMVTKRGQISKWIWVSKPQPTIGIWLCMSFRWKGQLHTLHRDLSFDTILRAFFVVRWEFYCTYDNVPFIILYVQISFLWRTFYVSYFQGWILWRTFSKIYPMPLLRRAFSKIP